MTRRPPPRARVVVSATLALFFAVFALLVFQLRSGRDPALGDGTALASSHLQPATRAPARKVVLTRVIVHVPGEGDKLVTVPVTVVTPQGSAATSAPAAPVPPVAASRPAPAPLSTRSS
jgi:hypothetical protein